MILGIYNLENNADNLEHNAVELQEILNRIMQRIMSIITSALISVPLYPPFPPPLYVCACTPWLCTNVHAATIAIMETEQTPGY